MGPPAETAKFSDNAKAVKSAEFAESGQYAEEDGAAEEDNDQSLGYDAALSSDARLCSHDIVTGLSQTNLLRRLVWLLVVRQRADSAVLCLICSLCFFSVEPVLTASGSPNPPYDRLCICQALPTSCLEGEAILANSLAVFRLPSLVLTRS